jgi:hypothetical protein
MIRYLYNRQTKPPAPFVHVTVRGPGAAKEVGNLPAQVDTAADRTVLPWNLVEELGLVQLDELPFTGFGGHVTLQPTFVVQVGNRPLHP